MEVWKPIPFASSYQASSLGRLIGLRGHVMKPTINSKGTYLVCDLHKKQYRVNRVVCWTFHGEPPAPEFHAAHKDNDSFNNEAENLYWATPLQNASDLTRSGRNLGSNSFAAILSEEDVIEIRRLHKLGYRIVEIASYFEQVNYAAISHIIHRRSWKHVP